jgi:hypothetical protein
MTVSNYSAISTSHTLQFTTTSIKPSQSAGFHQLFPGVGSQQCPLLPCSCSYRLETVPQVTHCPVDLLTTSRQRPHRKHRSSVAVQLLLIRSHRKHNSSVIVCRPLPSNSCCTVAYLMIAVYQRVCMPQYKGHCLAMAVMCLQLLSSNSYLFLLWMLHLVFSLWCAALLTFFWVLQVVFFVQSTLMY